MEIFGLPVLTRYLSSVCVCVCVCVHEYYNTNYHYICRSSEQVCNLQERRRIDCCHGELSHGTQPFRGEGLCASLPQGL